MNDGLAGAPGEATPPRTAPYIAHCKSAHFCFKLAPKTNLAVLMQSVCPSCGAVVPRNTPRGLCPSCLFLGGVSGEPDAGEIVGNFRLIERIGKGGMGAVFRAEQFAPVRREVAFKLIKPGMDTEEIIARFEAERQALAMMDHPNIARVLEGGATPAGRPYFVMELVTGAPITEFCEQHKLPIRQRLELFQQLCRAVQHAHQKGVIHRDLKPSNILVSERDGETVLKVIDFGVAKALQQRLTERTLFTISGQMVGTPLYMSPEQVSGDPDIDTRADIYSLGVLLYELLTGVTPFDAARMKKAAFDEVIRIVREEEPLRPSTRASTLGDGLKIVAESRQLDAHALPRHLRGDLDWIAMRALEKERTRRYETAEAFAADVGRHLADEPVLAGPPSTAYRLRKYARRNRVALGAATVVSLALLAGIAVSTWQAVRATRAEATAQRQLYHSHMMMAHRDLQDERVARFQDLLATHRPTAGQHDLRGWEWFFLAGLGDRSLQTYRGHTGSVNTVAAAPDGQRFASGGNDGLVRLWQVTNDSPVRLLNGHTGAVLTLAWNRDDQHLASGGADGVVRIWDAHTGELLRALRGHTSAVNAVAWSRDGARVASVGPDHWLFVWSAADGRQLHAFPNSGDSLDAVAWSPNDEQILICHKTRSWLWTPETGAVQEQVFNQREMNCLDWHAGTGRIATGTRHWWLMVFEPGTRQPLLDEQAHKSMIHSVAWNAGGTRLASAARDGALKVRNVESNRQETVLFGHVGAVKAVTWLGTNDLLLSGGEDGTVRLWSGSGDDRVLTRTYQHWISGIAWSPNNRFAATAWFLNDVDIWDTVTGITVSRLSGHTNRINGLAWSRDGAQLATASWDRTVRLWDVRSGKERLMVRFPDVLASVGWHPDGARLFAALRYYSEVFVFDSQNGVELYRIKLSEDEHHEYNHPAAGWSPDGKELALGDVRGECTIVDARTGAQLRKFPARQMTTDEHPRLAGLAWSPDSRRLAFVRQNGDVEVRDAREGRRLFVQRAHTALARQVAWHPGGRRIATGGDDGIIKLLDADSGEEVLVLNAHENVVYALAWSPDGSKLASGSFDRTVKIFDTARAGELDGSTAGSPAVSSWRLDQRLSRVVQRLSLSPNESVAQAELDYAAARLNEHLQAMPDAPHLLAARGLVQLRRGKPAEAETDFTRVLRDDVTPANAISLKRARVTLAQAQSAQGRLAEALRTLRIPERAPDTPARLIDLSRYYNASLDEPFHSATDFALLNLTQLPHGVQELDGVPFDLRGIVQLNGSELARVVGPRYPEQVRGIAIGRPVRRLHLLHAMGWTASSVIDRAVARLVFHYADGTPPAERPLVVGQDMHNWLVLAKDQTRIEATKVRMAWQGGSPGLRQAGSRAVLYLTTWENPRPTATISRVDYEKLTTESAPFLVAMTVEE